MLFILSLGTFIAFLCLYFMHMSYICVDMWQYVCTLRVPVMCMVCIKHIITCVTCICVMYVTCVIVCCFMRDVSYLCYCVCYCLLFYV